MWVWVCVCLRDVCMCVCVRVCECARACAFVRIAHVNLYIYLLSRCTGSCFPGLGLNAPGVKSSYHYEPYSFIPLSDSTGSAQHAVLA